MATEVVSLTEGMIVVTTGEHFIEVAAYPHQAGEDTTQALHRYRYTCRTVLWQDVQLYAQTGKPKLIEYARALARESDRVFGTGPICSACKRKLKK